MSDSRRNRSGVPLETRVTLLEEEMRNFHTDLHSHLDKCDKNSERVLLRSEGNRKWLLYIAAGTVLIIMEKTVALVSTIAAAWVH